MDGLESQDLLGHAVLRDREVRGGEAEDGVPRAVRDHRVHGHELRAGRKGRRLLLGQGGGGEEREEEARLVPSRPWSPYFREAKTKSWKTSGTWKLSPGGFE